jgi:hypothetical protein
MLSAVKTYLQMQMTFCAMQRVRADYIHAGSNKLLTVTLNMNVNLNRTTLDKRFSRRCLWRARSGLQPRVVQRQPDISEEYRFPSSVSKNKPSKNPTEAGGKRREPGVKDTSSVPLPCNLLLMFLSWITLRAWRGGNIFLQNARFSPNYSALQSKRPLASNNTILRTIIMKIVPIRIIIGSRTDISR